MGRPLTLERTMNHDSYSDTYIRGILNTVKTIAMVGASEKEIRPSYFVFKYLLERNYTHDSGQSGTCRRTSCSGDAFYARLTDIPEPIDMVDIFRAVAITRSADRAGSIGAQSATAGDLDATWHSQR